MPIKPENKHRYPKNWKQIRAGILKRANNRCEWCDVVNYSMVKRDYTNKPIQIVLTIAHLDHTPENCNPENLVALCQKCHLNYDREQHIKNRAMFLQARLEKEGQIKLL